MAQLVSVDNGAAVNTRSPAPVVFRLAIADPDTHMADLTIDVPTDGRPWIELMMARWSPGFYRVEEYATQVQALTATTPDDARLRVEQPSPQRWRIHTGTASMIRVQYQLVCTGTTVTTNWVGAEYAVINGPATFLKLDDHVRRPYEVTVVIPPHWSSVWTGLPPYLHDQPNQYRYVA